MHRFIFVLFLFALRAEAAMVRVVSIESSRTIAIERNGAREVVSLAGIAITNDPAAIDLLRRTIGGAWVLLESTSDGAFVYRSPDALFINRELVLRGVARATMPGIVRHGEIPMIVLGIVNPAGTQSRDSSASAETKRGGRKRAAPRTRK